MTKVESLSILKNVMEVHNPDIKKDTKTNEFPFLDIHKNSPYKETIKYCYEHGLISKSHHFYPETLIKKAEIIKILSNTPHIKSLIKQIFDE